MKKNALPVILISPLLFFSCAACSLPFGDGVSPEELTIMSWNVQNLFDDVTDGGEYDEFNPSLGDWNSALFHDRLEKIGEIFDSVLDEYPQIVLLQEVENLNTLNLLVETGLRDRYPWRVLLEDDGLSVHTALLSMLPVESVSSHETGYWGRTKLRPIAEIRIPLDEGNLYLFNNHWKSRSGGAGATEDARLSSARILTERIGKIISADPRALVLAAGDFNENHDEYRKIGRTYRTAIIPAIETVPDEWGDSLYVCSKGSDSSLEGRRLVLFSPWYDVRSAGTYVYKSRWSKLDHFFLWHSFFDGEGYEYESFEVVRDALLLNEYNYPARWDSFTGGGYSDHLPILLRIIKNDV